jgi:hypothetical protein
VVRVPGYDRDAAREAITEMANDERNDSEPALDDLNVVEPEIGIGPYGTSSAKAWRRWRDRMKTRGALPPT